MKPPSLFDDEPLAEPQQLREVYRFGFADGRCLFGLPNHYAASLRGDLLAQYQAGYHAGLAELRRRLGDTAAKKSAIVD